MSGRTQRQRKLTDMGVQYKKQVIDSTKKADERKNLQDAMKELAKAKITTDRASVTLTSGPAQSTSRSLPGSSIIRPSTFMYPPPPKDDEMDKLTSSMSKLGGKTRRRVKKQKRKVRR